MMDQFKNDIEAFLVAHDMKPSTFGRKFVGDPGFVFRIRDGGECRFSTLEAVTKKMRKHEKAAA